MGAITDKQDHTTGQWFASQSVIEAALDAGAHELMQGSKATESNASSHEWTIGRNERGGHKYHTKECARTLCRDWRYGGPSNSRWVRHSQTTKPLKLTLKIVPYRERADSIWTIYGNLHLSFQGATVRDIVDANAVSQVITIDKNNPNNLVEFEYRSADGVECDGWVPSRDDCNRSLTPFTQLKTDDERNVLLDVFSGMRDNVQACWVPREPLPTTLMRTVDLGWDPSSRPQFMKVACKVFLEPKRLTMQLERMGQQELNQFLSTNTAYRERNAGEQSASQATPQGRSSGDPIYIYIRRVEIAYGRCQPCFRQAV